MSKANSYVLGVNFRRLAEHEIGHSPAAALLKNGVMVAMAEEERFARLKDAPGFFPTRAVQFCLQKAGIELEQVEAIGWNWDPHLHERRSLARRTPAVRMGVRAVRKIFEHGPLQDYIGYLPTAIFPERMYEQHCSAIKRALRTENIPKVIPVDHHLAHAASAFYPSGFDEATVVTWDAYGDDLSAMACHGRDGNLEVLDEYPFKSFSIGMIHHTLYKFLRLSEKGNLMGLAGYGQPRHTLDALANPAKLTMNVDSIVDDGPFSKTLLDLIGPPRGWEETLTDHHKSLSADLQKMVEDFGSVILERAVARTGCRRVCFAGGVALNATMNGKFFSQGQLDEMFVQPAAGDSGGSLGAAFIAHQRLGHEIPRQVMTHACWGSSFTNDEVRAVLDNVKVGYEQVTDDEIVDQVSQEIVDGRIVGWFRGGAEFGPRALGARSILADPRSVEMRDQINAAVKYRDKWRPFAASMLAEAAGDYFTSHTAAPFMIVTFPVREEKRRDLAAVVHVDGTTRPQLVERPTNPLYYDVIAAFGKKTGVPALLNTSFNLKGEPLVNTPLDALRTFFSSGIDTLVLQNCLVRKPKP